MSVLQGLKNDTNRPKERRSVVRAAILVSVKTPRETPTTVHSRLNDILRTAMGSTNARRRTHGMRQREQPS